MTIVDTLDPAMPRAEGDLTRDGNVPMFFAAMPRTFAARRMELLMKRMRKAMVEQCGHDLHDRKEPIESAARR